MAFQLGECLLRYHLKKNNMKPAEFARRMNVTRQYINDLMTADLEKRAIMSLTFAINAGHILNCRPDEFYRIIQVS